MKINDPAAFGEAIRQRRKALHYTQAHVAAVTGFSVSFISDMERGKATAERGKALSLSALESMREKVESQILMRRSCFLRLKTIESEESVRAPTSHTSVHTQ